MKKLNLSIIITAKDKNDPKLLDLLSSIGEQTYPKEHYEILVITEGDSESAKAIGVRQAKGKIVGIFASDNYLNDKEFISKCMKPFRNNDIVGTFPIRYFYNKKDNILNRYFSLIGGNDPLAGYLGKNDKESYLVDLKFQFDYKKGGLKRIPTLGDNGFFIRRSILLYADLDHYYHIDVCQDLFNKGYRTYAIINTSIWHRTGGNILKFFFKRYKYADKFLYNRRWHMVTKQDLPKVRLFILSTITPLSLFVPFMGYKKIRDIAWFLHPLVCLLTIITYGLLYLKNWRKYDFSNNTSV